MHETLRTWDTIGGNEYGWPCPLSTFGLLKSLFLSEIKCKIATQFLYSAYKLTSTCILAILPESTVKVSLAAVSGHWLESLSSNPV